MRSGARTFVELAAGGSDDPDGLRAGTVLSAYFHAEHMRTFRRLLWQRLGALASIWFILSLTPLFSRVAIASGFGLFGAVGCWASIVEWNAENRLKALLDDLPASGARSESTGTELKSRGSTPAP
jgi:hypothetical protein